MKSFMSFLNDIFGEALNSEPTYPSTQVERRVDLFENMVKRAQAIERAAELVTDIIEKNEKHMKFDDEGHLIVVGRLALYKVDMKGFLVKMTNPFSYHSFDVVEVHPKRGLVKKPKTACVQVRQQDDMPAYDLMAGYLLGLLNDHVTWLQEGMQPLQRTLFELYGLHPSPLTQTLSQHVEDTVNGAFDFANDSITFDGTNGWKWRLSFGQPLARGFKIEYQKPRQSWWNPLFEDHVKETTGHYIMNGFFETVSHLSQCPEMLKTADEWDTDPIFIRRIATDYPPLAKALVANVINDEDYDPYHIQTYYDDTIDEGDADTVAMLDDHIRMRAHAY